MIKSARGIAGFILATRRHELAKAKNLLSCYRFAKLQVVSRITGQPKIVPFVDDCNIFVSSGFTGANGNHYWGLHEFRDMAFTLHFLRPGDVFIDAGANHGSYTLLASGAAGARTIAFEPVPGAVERLRANIETNHLSSLADVRSVCLGSRAGTASFSIDAGCMNHIVPDGGSANGATMEVAMRRLDQEIASPPTLIKIDAEGFDDDVVEGCKAILQGANPMAIMIEAPSLSTVEKLEALGFDCVSYDPFARLLSKRSSRDARHSNELFIRGLPMAAERVLSAKRFELHGFGQI